MTLAADYAGIAASDALRRGQIVRVGSLAVLSAELADDAALAALETRSRAGLIITARRAAVLNLANQIAAAAADPEPVWVERPAWLDLEASRAVADPVLDLATPMKGPFRTRPLGEDTDSGRAAITLAKHAGLIPAVYAVPHGAAEAVVETSAGLALALPAQAARLRIASRARLPLALAPDTQVVAFRSVDGGPEHLALLIGDPNPVTTVLSRLHSACLTGDVLGSLKCDCGPQLHAALAAIAANPGGGILLYLQQEGRGIGLINKLRAYALQDQGFDTVDANTRLGFEPDERDFSIAAAMLTALGVRSVELLTNNPDEVAGLAAHGLTASRRAHAMPPNPHNHAYLATKRDRQGHQL
ncbi:GTP cyclohydrolase-2 [Polymorphobacter multimanifer]|uniref:GTP cyclohydrolase II n=1 Tax=Polymorphobacter multimanifer TaxID=1070431 RepID=UPI00198CBB48|nr:GTP cyclohydrolase II [Polymorphobacter multimanifer]GGI71668.1 GTP cyclohydrolase-2 [Polymorphobacter multimanifer]